MTPSLVLFRRLALAGVLLALVVVVLGAWVRLSAAGLGCPDWPGCYGHLSAGSAAENVDAVNQAFPHRPFEYHKAIKEMVHRYFASGLGLLILVLAGLAIRNREDPQQPVALPIALVALVIFQGLLGMWTVTLLLKPLIVVLHLIGGLSTLSLLAWLAMRPPQVVEQSDNGGLRKLAALGLAMLALQIMLGGWTSSNYAALACPDFPTCQNSYWPDMDMKDAFVLWRGLGIDYEGGVLDHPARVAIHFVHRLGAIAAALLLGALSFLAWRRGTTPAVRTAGVVLGLILVAQLILGPVMVMRALPLALATAHNGVAALLLLATVRMNRLLR
ncbi:heme A synthase [Steroidobacter agaridevorans]|uniref:Heme A synthase n=1 Tax=Steroidobacter agaridevorans TaxID=2695856 RepID=A0A829Y5A2_9GAMM|nr:COX15/CtaA family protein [Steroidobacter agaridevorans]GFE78374.1 heme A synthase [Steroidobacter agaridevorans]